MIRRVLGDSTVDFLKKIPPLNYLNEALRRALGSMRNVSYFLWRVLFERRFDRLGSVNLEDARIHIMIEHLPEQRWQQKRLISWVNGIVHDGVAINVYAFDAVYQTLIDGGMDDCIKPIHSLIDVRAAPDDLVVPINGRWLPSKRLTGAALEYLASFSVIRCWTCDSDQINRWGWRSEVFFKPSFDKYLLRELNYIGDMLACKAAEWFSIAMETTTADDRVFLLTEQLEDRQIGHHSRVLQHRLTHGWLPNSKALADHLRRQNLSVEKTLSTVPPLENIHYRSKEQPLVSIVIPTRNGIDILKQCIDSLQEKTTYPYYEVIIVDNGSDCERTLAYLKEVVSSPRVRVYPYNEPFNYSAINNFGFSHATGDVYVLLNNDTEVISEDWLDDMVGIAMQSDVGCVGAKLLYFDNTIQHAGVAMGLGGYAGHSHRFIKDDAPGYFGTPHLTQQVSVVTAACLAVRREVWDAVGGLNQAYAVAFNDVDFCLRVKEKGFHNIYCATAKLYHYESKSRGLDTSGEKLARYEKERALLREQWLNYIHHDPHYSPHLTKKREDFSLRLDYSRLL